MSLLSLFGSFVRRVPEYSHLSFGSVSPLFLCVCCCYRSCLVLNEKRCRIEHVRVNDAYRRNVCIGTKITRCFLYFLFCSLVFGWRRRAFYFVVVVQQRFVPRSGRRFADLRVILLLDSYVLFTLLAVHRPLDRFLSVVYFRHATASPVRSVVTRLSSSDLTLSFRMNCQSAFEHRIRFVVRNAAGVCFFFFFVH